MMLHALKLELPINYENELKRINNEKKINEKNENLMIFETEDTFTEKYFDIKFIN
jgi:hypothetical protein